jgi:autotransporter translocation and assembly factor TamB
VDLPLRADLRDVGVFARGFGLPSLAGRATFAGRLAGTRDLPLLLGRLTWREARLGAQGFDHIEAAVEVAPRAIRSSRLRFRAGRTRAVLRGSLTAGGSTPLRALDWRRDLILDLQGQVSPARTADIIALLPEDLEIRGAFRVSGRLTGSPRALHGDLRLQLENVRTWDESWQRGDALLHFEEGAVEIRQISLRRGEEQLGGEIHLSAEGELGGSLTSTPVDLAKAGFLSGSQLGGRGSFRLNPGHAARHAHAGTGHGRSPYRHP